MIEFPPRKIGRNPRFSHTSNVTRDSGTKRFCPELAQTEFHRGLDNVGDKLVVQLIHCFRLRIGNYLQKKKSLIS